MEHAYGYIKDGKIYRNAFLDFPDRQIGEIKDDIEKSLAYFEERFELAKQKVTSLTDEIKQSENKGAYLMKLIHLKKYLANFDGLGDYVPLFDQLSAHEQELNALIEKNRIKNLEIKRSIVAELEVLLDLNDWEKVEEQVGQLKLKWLRTGNVDKQYREELDEKYQALLDQANGLKDSHYLKHNQQVTEHIESYQGLIEQAKGLNLDNLEQAAQEIRKIHMAWKEIGKIPQKKLNELWGELCGITSPIYEKYKFEKEKSKQENTQKFEEDNLAQKKALLEELQLIEQEPNKEAIEKLKVLKEKWKAIGKVPDSAFKQLQEQFYAKCDRLSEEFFLSKLVAQKVRNFSQKPPAEQKRHKVNLLKNLLTRDIENLNTYQENMANVNSNPQFSKMLETKFRAQQRKVNVKQQLLKELEG